MTTTESKWFLLACCLLRAACHCAIFLWHAHLDQHGVRAEHSRILAFDEIFAKGGTCVTDGDMPGALGYFQQALEIDPTNKQTQKMVSKLTSLGVTAVVDPTAVAQARANAVRKLLERQEGSQSEDAVLTSIDTTAEES